MRLNKHIAESGTCSRREADRLVAEGRVTVNGQRAGIGAADIGTQQSALGCSPKKMDIRFPPRVVPKTLLIVSVSEAKI